MPCVKIIIFHESSIKAYEKMYVFVLSTHYLKTFTSMLYLEYSQVEFPENHGKKKSKISHSCFFIFSDKLILTGKVTLKIPPCYQAL